ncbi:unnamed protein product [Paramecium octaurelia]|uniref:Uncharacterized protein n=1 Tax=Paramecium octaurelia TaxID=43137 RepID=A0A8S1YPL5_PAROT|nr:unnamed protein product [Paramecium octaurelia]
MLKYQYFIDTCKNKEQQIPQLCDIVKEKILIGYSDLEIWFSIKKYSDHIDQVKKIWDQTDQVNCKSSLDSFLHSYAVEIHNVFMKYKQHLEKVKQLQLIDKRISKIVQDTISFEEMDANKSLQITFQIMKIDEFNILDFQKDDKNYIYTLELSYQTLLRKIKGNVETVAQRLNFEQEIMMDLAIDIGTLQINLFQEYENDQICIAQRNLDPFTHLNEELKQFPLKVNGKDKYINLQMKITCLDNVNGYLRTRQKYLKDQHEKLYKKCHKYKTKLTLLLKPFQLIKFDDENIYLQKIQQKQKNKECWNCLIQ